MSRERRRALRPTLEILDDRCLLSALSPAQVTHAYGLDAITFNVNGQTIKGDGRGQIIAIVGAFHDPYVASDLHVFDQTFHLPDPAIGVVNLAGSKTDDGWASEETLDVEWAHAIAPAAKIVVVEAKSDSIADLVAAVKVARTLPGVTSISMSWGGSEFSGQKAYDGVFTTPVGHVGITFIAASGDEGASGGAEWPSSSPNVLAVGGTSLRIDSSSNYSSESLWSGSSGGSSSVEAEPSYQGGVQSTGRRSTPDVSFDADPNTGVYVYTTLPSRGRSSWQQVGGTSVGAPAWAGIMAIVDQGRSLTGKGSLYGPSQTLPALYALSSSVFHSVASLSSSSRIRAAAVTTAGLGTPNGAALVNGLVFGNTTAIPSRTIAARSPVSTTVQPKDSVKAIAVALASSTGQKARPLASTEVAPARGNGHLGILISNRSTRSILESALDQLASSLYGEA